MLFLSRQLAVAGECHLVVDACVVALVGGLLQQGLGFEQFGERSKAGLVVLRGNVEVLSGIVARFVGKVDLGVCFEQFVPRFLRLQLHLFGQVAPIVFGYLHFFVVCSQFVAQLLSDSGACRFSKRLCMVKPKDFERQFRSKEIYCGLYRSLKEGGELRESVHA